MADKSNSKVGWAKTVAPALRFLSVVTLLFALIVDAPARESTAIPAVYLSSAHAALCKVKVGDEMPAPKLPDLKGKSHDPKEFAGRNATVVILWQGAGTSTRMLLADVGPDVLDTFGGDGVAVIGVSVQQDVATTEQQLAAAKANFPVLLDVDGAASAKVGEAKKLPRVYVVNADGRVVWFDIEYSRATRRELRKTLEALTK